MQGPWQILFGSEEDALDGRQDLGNIIREVLSGYPLANDDEHGVIARDGAADRRQMSLVDVRGDAAGIALAGVQDADVTREDRADQSALAKVVRDNLGRDDAMITRYLGYDVSVPVALWNLDRLHLFQVA